MLSFGYRRSYNTPGCPNKLNTARQRKNLSAQPGVIGPTVSKKISFQWLIFDSNKNRHHYSNKPMTERIYVNSTIQTK